MSLQNTDRLATAFTSLRGYRHWYIGFSGGLDSTVLLHLAKNYLSSCYPDISNRPTLTAIHINHQLSAQSSEWMAFCQRCCDQWGITLLVESAAIKNSRGNLEQRARQARYAAFAKLTDKENSVLLLAHHANDQAETLLLRLMRGAGVSGAAAIPVTRYKLSRADHEYDALPTIYRPLLSISRAELKHYASTQALEWIEDESNQDLAFDRNYLRHCVLPALVKRWPAAIEVLGRHSALALEADQLCKELAEQDFNQCKNPDGHFGENLLILKLRSLSSPRRRNVYRYWLGHKFDYLPSSRQLTALDNCVDGDGEAFEWAFNNSTLYSHRGGLYWVDNRWLTKLGRIDTEYVWNGCSALIINDTLQFVPPGRNESNSPGLKPGEYFLTNKIRLEQQLNADDKSLLTMQVNGCTKTLKKLLQEFGVPRWLRDYYPIVCTTSQLKIAALGDRVFADEFVDKHKAHSANFVLKIDF